MYRMTTPFASIFALAASGTALAQSFNLDVGANQSHPLPAAAYGAAANQTGTWFGVPTTAQTPVTLTDINGNVTSVTITPTGGWGDFAVNNPTWTGDDDLLMEDATDVGGIAQGAPGGSITWTVAGLQAGSYEIYTYAAAPDFPAAYNTRTNVVGASQGAQVTTGAWAGSPHVLGVTYAFHTVMVGVGQNVTIVTDDPGTIANNFATVNGFQIKQTAVGPFGTPFCSGDAVGTACLGCGNNGAVGRGCANSSFPAGTLLADSGIASVGADTLVLTATDMPGPGLFFQANGLGSINPFGDGMLCAAVGIIRMGVVFPSPTFTASYPGGLTPNPVSIAGAPINAGDTKHYQCWYRDAAPFCSSSTFNTTNGVTLTWGP